MFRASFPSSNNKFRTNFPTVNKFGKFSIEKTPEVSVLKETFKPSNLWSSLGEVGKIALQLPKMTLIDPFTKPSELTKTFESKTGFSGEGLSPAVSAITAPLRYTGQAILRSIIPLFEPLGTIAGQDILAQREFAKETVEAKPVVIGKQVESAVNQLLVTKKVGAPEIVGTIIASIPPALLIAPFISRAATAGTIRLSNAIAKESRVPITFKDMQKITSASSDAEAISRVGKTKFDAYIDATKTDTVKQALQQGYVSLAEKQPTVFSNILKNAATRPITEIAQFGKTYGAKIEPSTTLQIPERIVTAKPQTAIKQVATRKLKPFPITEKPIITPTVTQVPKTAVIPESPLLQEARKYKSAEEFVKAQESKYLYHGTNKTTLEAIKEQGIVPQRRGISSLSTSENYSKNWADNPWTKTKGVMFRVKKNVLEGKLVKREGSMPATDKQFEVLTNQVISPKDIEVKTSDGWRSLTTNELSQTKSQLTSIWEEANKGVGEVAEAPAKIEGQTPSKIAKSVEQKAIEKKLTTKFENLAGYDKITIADQAQKSAKLFENPEQALGVIKGEIDLPEGLRGTAVITAAEEYIARTGDARMAYELANSPLVSETSAAAQELRLAAEREPDSLTLKLQSIRQAREKAAIKKHGSDAKTKVKKEIKEEIQKSAPKAKDWASFLEELKCT